MSTKNVLLVILAASIIVLAIAFGPRIAGTAGAVPTGQKATGSIIPYSGRLSDDAGAAVPDGAYDFTFALYDAPGGGTLLWSETQSEVAVQGGSFTVLLGSVNPLPATAAEGKRWLAVEVRGPGESTFSALAPRQELSAVSPAAPASPDTAAACAHDHLGEWWTTGSSSYGLVIENTGTGTGDGLRVYNAASMKSYAALWAINESNGVAVYGESSTGYGVYGVGHGNGGIGVYGKTDGWIGVYGVSEGTDDAVHIGVAGETYGSDPDNAIAVQGIAKNAAGGVGVRGIGYGLGIGVKGMSDYKAVEGIASGTSDAVGVQGNADAAGCNAGDNGCWGVVGHSTNGIGVLGSTSGGVAIYGSVAGDGVGLRVYVQSGGPLIEAWQGPIGPDRRFAVDINGNVVADGSYTSPAADMAELLPAAAGLQAGDVLVVGADGKLARSTQPYQASVAGVYSTKPAFVGGAPDDGETDAGKVPLAVVGVAPVKVTAENGPIHPGDSLTTSSTAGHAMRADPITLNGITFYPSGVIIGKALGTLEKGSGVILMLVILQ